MNRLEAEHLVFRPARESERNDIARCIAEGFERDFSFFSKDAERVAGALAPGVHPQRFFVAVFGDEIAGVAAISDCTGRALSTSCLAYWRHFGWWRGILAKLVLRNEFEHPLPYPSHTGFIEFVAIRKGYRRQGIASSLLRAGMRQAGYAEYVLEAIEENAPAMACYAKLGFQPFAARKKKSGYTLVSMRLGGVDTFSQPPASII